MADRVGHPVRIEITKILEGGKCPAEFEVGDVWEVRDGLVPAGMCASAWSSIQQYVFALRSGGAMPWSGRKEITVCCPDAANPVVFHITVGEE